MSKPASNLNTEYDSRIVRVSIGAAGMTRPTFASTSSLQRVYCLHCGKDGGAVTQIPAALRGDPGVIYICDECDGKFGTLPAHAIGFEGRA